MKRSPYCGFDAPGVVRGLLVGGVAALLAGIFLARWRLECKMAVANEPMGRILLRIRLPKWKSWLNRS